MQQFISSTDFKDLFISRLPTRPWCANDYTKGLKIRNRDDAMEFANIQVNPPHLISSMVFDVDYADVLGRIEDRNLPKPTWISFNKNTKFSHCGYMLETPVYRSKNASEKALKYYKAVHAGYVEALNSDSRYKTTITKNPFHDAWQTIHYGHLYSLNELSEYVELNNKKIHTEVEGRNCYLFEELRKAAYKLKANGCENLREELDAKAAGLNSTLPSPLELSEVKTIVKSVCKWVIKNFDPNKFKERQRNIRLMVGDRTKRAVLSEDGTIKEIAEKLGLCERTVRRHQSVMEFDKDEILKPWEQMGISRATWYRKHKGE